MRSERNTGDFGVTAPPLRYRRDIDGLRALAILPVVLFHAEIPGFGGGFIGVDVFFVISGYLITQVLAARADMPMSQALAEFYVRRARRILPALVCMLAVVAVVATVLLLPVDLTRLGMFLALSAAFLGNLAAWLGGGYFDTAGASLLHLWSIGIEEQFYVLYPLLFLAVARHAPRAMSGLLILLAALSLGLCVWASYAHPVVNFYAPATRAWELLLGALVAQNRWSGWGNPRGNELAAAAALLVLVASFIGIDAGMRHPGLVTLAPCAATAVLLATGARHGTFVARTLGIAPLVFTGLLSYSLYLWHAPILSLVRYYEVTPPSTVYLTAQLWTIYLVAYASWRWVERPLRMRVRVPSDRLFVASFAAASLSLSLIGILMWQSDGWPARFSREVQALALTTRGLGKDVARCMTFTPAELMAGNLCAYGPVRPRVSMLVWGDSHALALLPAYRELARREHARVWFAGYSSCRPLLGKAAGDDKCLNFNDAMLRAIERLRPDVVVINAYWNYPDFIAPRSAGPLLDLKTQFAAGLDATLRGVGPGVRKICAVLDVPTHAYPVPYALAMTARKGKPLDFLRLSRERAFEQQREVDGIIRSFESDDRLITIDPKDVLCDGRECRLQAPDGRPLYNDGNHLSVLGAMTIVDSLARCLPAR